MEEKPIIAAPLPAEAVNFIERIARKCSWRRGTRKEVRRELSAHFEDALSGMDETEKNAIAQELIKDFGNPAVLAALIGRGKRRCQPWWERALLMTVKVAAVMLLLGVPADIVLSRLSGAALQAEIAKIRSTGAPTTVQEFVEQAQNEPGFNTLSREEHLKRCPATTLLYELSKLKTNVDTDVRGKRVFAMDSSCASMAPLCDTWDADTAAAVDGTVSRNREVIEKMRALAALPPDDPANVIWFQAQYSPEKTPESRVLNGDTRATNEFDRIVGPEDLLSFLDASYLMTLDAARALREQGADAALDDATTVMALSNHVGGACHILVGTMVAIAIRSIAMTSIVQPLLNRADASDAAVARFLEMATRMDCTEALAKSFCWQRMFFLRTLTMIENGEHVFASVDGRDSLFTRLCKTRFDPFVLRARLLPFLHDKDAMTALGFSNSLVEAATLPYPEYKARASAWLDDIKKTSAWAAPIAKSSWFNFINIRDDATICQAHEDLARVAFALRRFKLARGAYPDCLQTLEPAFLPKVPVDRFNGGPLLYRRQEEGCVFYSVCINQRDDGGKDKDFGNTGQIDDLVWKLTR